MVNGTAGFSRRRFIAAGAGLLAAANTALGQKGSYSDGNFAGGPITGPFRPNWESLKAYRYPDWFRDAKFGMWAHWSPQCVPEQGDWYARGMYVQGSSQYDYHVKTYGHPSQLGYKDICHIWRAENWNPEELIRLYAKTGAKYFVALGNHHGNFDCWNSKHQPWNCVNVGPKKDIVGTWGKVARAHGLKFGITYHGTPGRVWREFMPVRYGSDKTGPLKDVPYDGVMTKADGKDNRDRLEEETALVLARFPWVQMVVFPELCSFGPRVDRAETMPGPTETRYQELARKRGIWLIPGSIYERAGGEVFNTAPVIDPAGRVVSRYRKMYPFLPYEKGVTPGTEFVVFDVPDAGRFGVSICYDQWVPETTRALVWKGAEAVIHPTSTGTIDRAQELILAQANAIANQCYFVDVNNAGRLGNGRSIVVGPQGEILHQSGDVGEWIPFTVDFDHVREVRRSGSLRLGQILKSFRDTPIAFPCYRGAYEESPAMAALGPLTEVPKSGSRTGR